MSARPETIAGRSFASQDALRTYVRAILQRSSPPVRLEGEAAAVMAALLLRHPHAADKIGVGVRALWVRHNIVVPSAGFYVERTDGTFIDFSYRQCLRPATPEHTAKLAFRIAVADQVAAVKQAAFG